MSNVKRVYVEKKPGFGVQAGSLKSEIKSYLGIKNIAAKCIYKSISGICRNTGISWDCIYHRFYKVLYGIP